MILRKRFFKWLLFCGVMPVAILALIGNAAIWMYLFRAGLDRTAWAVMAATGILVVSLSLAYIVYRVMRKSIDKRLSNPYHELLEAGDWLMQTAFEQDPTLTSISDDEQADEVGVKLTPVQQRLEEWFYDMRRELEAGLTAHVETMERDLELAKDFQRSLLERPYPQVPSVHVEGHLRLSFHHCYQPASALGGDFFDILKLGPDSAGVFIADVMGHGTRSALITSILRTLIGDLMSQGGNARHFLTEMNKQFCELLENVPDFLFASAFYFVADTTSRIATFATAGHPSPFLMRSKVGKVHRLEVPPPMGAALGLIPDESFTAGHCRLNPGDVFIFYTDGVYEAANHKGEEYGIQRMEKALNALRYKNVREIVDGLLESVMAFCGDQPVADDICIIGVEVNDRAAQ